MVLVGFPHEEKVDPVSVGMDPDRVAAAIQRFQRQQARKAFPGGQMVVRRGGKLVIDTAVGVARGWRPEEGVVAPVTPTTRFAVFSAGKPVVAMAIALLEERGQLDVEAPVAAIWPEFGRHGKQDISVLDVLTHRAGVMLPDVIRRPEVWGDADHVRDALEAAEPRWPRGTLAYAPYEFGWILAEVLERVSGRTLVELVAEEIAGPLGIPGLRFGAAVVNPPVARAYWLGKKKTVVAEVEISEGFERVWNDPEVLRTVVPGAGLVCDAADLAAFYEALLRGGVWKEPTVRRYTARHAAGIDRSNRVPLSVARGFLLGTWGLSVYGWFGRSCFGHAGAFSTLAFGDWATGLAVAVVTNGNSGSMDMLRRFARLSGALRSAVT